MKETLSTLEIADRLFRDENASFTYAGAHALAEYLEQLEEDCGEEIEFDRVAIRCDFAEYESLVEWAEDYFAKDWKSQIGWDFDHEASELARADKVEAQGEIADANTLRRYLEEDLDSLIRDYIKDRGTLLEFGGGIIVSSF